MNTKRFHGLQNVCSLIIDNCLDRKFKSLPAHIIKKAFLKDIARIIAMRCKKVTIQLQLQWASRMHPSAGCEFVF